MRWLVATVMLVALGCAGTARTCPVGARLVTEDPPSGRIEWCAKTTGGITALPAPGRDVSSLLAMARPSMMSGGVDGPYTHWHPSGAVESHGSYVDDGASSMPDGAWGFWYADGSPKGIGAYQRGRPTGCFAVWDEQGSRITGMVDGDQIRVEQCEPPSDDSLVAISERSQPHAARPRWGDIAVQAGAELGSFGARNASQTDPDPSGRGAVQVALRKHLGRLRIGGAIGLRLSEGDAQSYVAGAIVAVPLPLPFRRLVVEIEALVGVQYFDLTARRSDLPGVGDVGFVSPLGRARLATSFALTPAVQIVGAFSVQGVPTREIERDVSYCAPFCTTVGETWQIGGAGFGLDLGLRLQLR